VIRVLVTQCRRLIDIFTGDETKVRSATANAVSVLVMYQLPGRMYYPNTKQYATLTRTIMLRSQLRFLINTKGVGRCYFSQQNIELFLLQSSWDLLSGLRRGNHKALKPSIRWVVDTFIEIDTHRIKKQERCMPDTGFEFPISVLQLSPAFGKVSV